METPLFSQIPSVVLKKFKPEARQKRKIVKFIEFGSQDDLPQEEVSSSLTGSTESPEIELNVTERCKKSPIKSLTKPHKSIIKHQARNIEYATEISSEDNPPPIVNKLQTIQDRSDAIVQTDLGPEYVSKETQTTDSFISDSAYDDYKNQMQAQSLSLCKPMYSIPKNGGKEPPLKIGLSLPRGKKRKVFYPDESDND